MKITNAEQLRQRYPELVKQFEEETRNEVRADALAKRVAKLERRITEQAKPVKTRMDRVADERAADIMEAGLDLGLRPDEILTRYRDSRLLREFSDSL